MLYGISVSICIFCIYVGRTTQRLSLPSVDTIKHDPSLVGDGKWPFGKANTGGNDTTELLDLPSGEDTTDANSLPCYQMKSYPQGIGVIINNRYFWNMDNRDGTEKDADALHQLFTYLGFYTNRYDDLTGSKMLSTLKEVAAIDHKRFDCLLIAILTHGIKGKLYGVDSELIPVEDLTKLFNGDQCPSLIGKPKIFFLQACRGENEDSGVKHDMKDGCDGREMEYLKTSEEQLDSLKPKIFEEVKEAEEADSSYEGSFNTLAIFTR